MRNHQFHFLSLWSLIILYWQLVYGKLPTLFNNNLDVALWLPYYCTNDGFLCKFYVQFHWNLGLPTWYSCKGMPIISRYSKPRFPVSRAIINNSYQHLYKTHDIQSWPGNNKVKNDIGKYMWLVSCYSNIELSKGLDHTDCLLLLSILFAEFGCFSGTWFFDGFVWYGLLSPINRQD